MDTPLGDIADVVVGPRVQPRQRDPIGGNRRRQQPHHVGVAVTGQRGDRHSMEPGIRAGRSPDIRVRVDPNDRQLVTIASGQFGEGCDTDRALTAKGDDPRRIMGPNNLERVGELPEDHLLGLDPVTQLRARIIHPHRHGNRRAVMRGQHRRQHRRTDCITTACHLERELRRKLAHAGGARALPLRPHQAQRHHAIAPERRPHRLATLIRRLGHVDLPAPTVHSRIAPNHGTVRKVPMVEPELPPSK